MGGWAIRSLENKQGEECVHCRGLSPSTDSQSQRRVGTPSMGHQSQHRVRRVASTGGWPGPGIRAHDGWGRHLCSRKAQCRVLDSEQGQEDIQWENSFAWAGVSPA